MTLHQLRLLIGDDSVFLLLCTWTRTHAGGNATTEQFIALAERISGQDLGAFFQTWLYTPTGQTCPARRTRRDPRPPLWYSSRPPHLRR